MSIFTHPEGSRLPALERNILKFRAFQMVLVIFHTQQLRDFISAVASYRGGGDTWSAALQTFVRRGLMSETEKKEVERLVRYRNDVAHRLQEMTADIGRTRIAQDFVEFRKPGQGYNYNALSRLKFYDAELSRRAQRSEIIPMTLDSLYFDAAQKTFEAELKRLSRVIERQLKERRAREQAFRASFKVVGARLRRDDPTHPANQYETGRLTKRGVEVCYRLFDAGNTPLAVAHLMFLSAAATRRRWKMWKAQGGVKRVRSSLRPANGTSNHRPARAPRRRR